MSVRLHLISLSTYLYVSNRQGTYKKITYRKNWNFFLNIVLLRISMLYIYDINIHACQIK